MGDSGIGKPRRVGCKCAAGGSVSGCWHHDPNFAGERARTASRAARSKLGSAETKAVKQLMDKLTTRTLEGEVLPQVVHAVVAMQNIKLRAIELERRVRETEELAADIEELKRELHGAA